MQILFFKNLKQKQYVEAAVEAESVGKVVRCLMLATFPPKLMLSYKTSEV